MRIGLLSCPGQPQLPLYIRALLSHGITDLTVIYDSKETTSKDLEIWQRRTLGALDVGAEFITTTPPGSAVPIDYHSVENHNHPDTVSLVKTLNIHCLINAGTPRKLSTPILDSTLHGVINIHPGILPQYRGCSCVEYALVNGDAVGNSAHIMDAGYDTGPILEVEPYQITLDMDYPAIRTLIYERGYELAGRTLAAIAREHPKPFVGTPQDESLARSWPPMPEQDFQALKARLDSKDREKS